MRGKFKFMPQPEDPMFAKYMKEIETEIPALMNREKAGMSELAHKFLKAYQYLNRLKELELLPPDCNARFIQDYFKSQVNRIMKLSTEGRQKRQSVLEGAQACMITFTELSGSHLITEDTQLAELLQIIENKLAEYAEVSGELEK
jgi:hypothetical protein